ncbi:MAG: M20/M25/M40 family metallo-hydrolase [Gammaproteobacteria bacterium]|jgi:glutamate carboxypeptidase|nr:M20/M25/M40 family metallo-hydrolase [Gammaproteobacteria bacterium]
MKKFFVFILFVTLTGSACALSTTDAVENKILRHIDSQEAEAVMLLQKAVNINSGTMNFAGVKKVGGLFINELNSLGFETSWVDGGEFKRAGHLFGKRGDKGLKILLIGHLDTVFAKESHFQSYGELPGNKLKGPGTTDMKGGDVIIIYILRALQAAGVLDNISVQVVMTGDEESRGTPQSVANKILIDSAKWADVALGFEDGDGDPKTAVISRRSASRWTLNVTGKPAHSSQIFRDDIGYGAIFEASRILDQFRTKLSTIPNLTFNPGLIVGGTDIAQTETVSHWSAFGKSNVIAQSVMVSGGIRAVSPEQLVMARQEMQSIVTANLTHTKATLVFSDGYPPMAPTEENKKLLSMYNIISLELGFGEVVAVDPRRAGAADISFTAEHVDMAMDGLGLMGEGGHTDEEIADMNTFTQQMKRSALLIYRLSSLDEYR